LHDPRNGVLSVAFRRCIAGNSEFSARKEKPI